MRLFPSQGKYISGDIKEVQCNRMQIHTPMVMDLKKMNDDDSDEIDPQLIGSLMYRVNTRPDLCYAVNAH
jgi:hypothetical protein